MRLPFFGVVFSQTSNDSKIRALGLVENFGPSSYRGHTILAAPLVCVYMIYLVTVLLFYVIFYMNLEIVGSGS